MPDAREAPAGSSRAVVTHVLFCAFTGSLAVLTGVGVHALVRDDSAVSHVLPYVAGGAVVVGAGLCLDRIVRWLAPVAQRPPNLRLIADTTDTAAPAGSTSSSTGTTAATTTTTSKRTRDSAITT